MSSTFLRGLALLEIVGVDGPIGITELARRVDADKATVSRMVSAAAEDGWLVRTGAGVQLGPRLPVLAHHTGLAGVLRAAQPLVDAVAGVTGLFTHVYLAVGRGMIPVLGGGRPPVGLPTPPALEIPIWAVAAGRALATLMSAPELAAALPTGALKLPPEIDALTGEIPRPVAGAQAGPGPAAATRAGFLDAVEQVRSTGVAYDHGDVHPSIHCIAMPWPGLGAPASVAVIGHPDEIGADGELVEAVLRAATGPGATRDRIVLAAADVAGARART